MQWLISPLVVQQVTIFLLPEQLALSDPGNHSWLEFHMTIIFSLRFACIVCFLVLGSSWIDLGSENYPSIMVFPVKL